MIDIFGFKIQVDWIDVIVAMVATVEFVVELIPSAMLLAVVYTACTLSQWQWYRRFRGGRWSSVTGYVWGRRWISLYPDCVETAQEDYTA